MHLLPTLLLKIISIDFYYDFEDCSSVLPLFIWTCAITSQKHRPQSPNDISLHKCATDWIDAIVLLWLIWFFAILIALFKLRFCCRPFVFDFVPTIEQLFTILYGLVWRKRLALCCCYWMLTAKAICNRARTLLSSSLLSGLFFFYVSRAFSFWPQKTLCESVSCFSKWEDAFITFWCFNQNALSSHKFLLMSHIFWLFHYSPYCKSIDEN